MSRTHTLYRLEVRPLTRDEYKGVLVWNPSTGKWEQYSLKRGRWFTAHQRAADGRFVFTAGKPGTTRRLLPHDAAQDGLERFQKRDDFAARIVPVVVDRWPRLTGDLDFLPAMGNALQRLAAKIGEDIDVLSGGRELAEQQHLYDLYLAGVGNLAAKPNPNAPHVRRIAADAYVRGVPLRTYLAQRDKLDLAAQCGLHFPVGDIEPWHAELVAS